MKAILENTLLGQLVAERPGRARVLERLGIDYYFGGQRTLKEACAAHSLDSEAVARALRASDTRQPDEEAKDWRQVSLSELIDHIITKHHAYLREMLPILSYLMDRVVHAHVGRHPELRLLLLEFEALRAELESHMGKEERVLFPLCERLEIDLRPDSPPRPALHLPIGVLEQEHREAGRALARMRELTRHFTPPGDACSAYRVLLKELADLEADLRQHIHKENNILYPRAIAAQAARTPRK